VVLDPDESRGEAAPGQLFDDTLKLGVVAEAAELARPLRTVEADGGERVEVTGGEFSGQVDRRRGREQQILGEVHQSRPIKHGHESSQG
jgi:hypothetical protein